MALNGITFEQRNVRALDDARVREVLFLDGRLNGCTITFSGANLTIARGVYMFAGREIAVDNNETFVTVPAYSNGYGRLKYVIDLSAAPSDENFTQGAAIWQYASTNSFAALTQNDINDGANTLYEVEICRVKYASGSIASIINQIDVSLHDYVCWAGEITAPNQYTGGDTWRVRQWRSGRIEANYHLSVANTDPITYAVVNGVCRSDPALISYGINFPFAMQPGMQMYTTVRSIRTGFCLQNVSFDANGIKGMRVWAPTAAPFDVTKSVFLDLEIKIEGVPV